MPPLDLLNMDTSSSDFGQHQQFEQKNREYRQVDDQQLALASKNDLGTSGEVEQSHAEQTNREYRRLEDQTDTTKNDLSHEAKYKLSKMEQDRAGTNKPAARRKRSIKSTRCGSTGAAKSDQASKADKHAGAKDDSNAADDVDTQYEDDSESEEDSFENPDVAELNEENATLIVHPLFNSTSSSSSLSGCDTGIRNFSGSSNSSYSSSSTTTTSTTTTTSLPPRATIGITVDVKINNVTKEHVTDCVRRKKETQEIIRRKKS